MKYNDAECCTCEEAQTILKKTIRLKLQVKRMIEDV